MTCELRMLKHLFKSPTPGIVMTPEGPVKKNFLEDLHPNSLKPIPDALVERRCHGAPVETSYQVFFLQKCCVGFFFLKKNIVFVQFERIGYFVVDPDSRPGKTVFNRTVSTKATKIRF